MPIAKVVDGAIVEWDETKTLADVATGQGWVDVQTIRPAVDPITETYAGWDIAVQPDGSVTMTMLKETMQPWWRRGKLRAHLASTRWDLVSGGVVWNGWPVSTDDRARGDMLAEFVGVGAGLRADGEVWKFKDGISRPLTNAEFSAMAMAVRTFVATAFEVEKTAQDGIAADTITTPEQIAALAWPSPLIS